MREMKIETQSSRSCFIHVTIAHRSRIQQEGYFLPVQLQLSEVKFLPSFYEPLSSAAQTAYSPKAIELFQFSS